MAEVTLVKLFRSMKSSEEAFDVVVGMLVPIAVILWREVSWNRVTCCYPVYLGMEPVPAAGLSFPTV